MPRKPSAIVPASAISPPGIEARIHQVRGQRVMLDRDLAEMYGVDTKVLNQAVARNASRFPADFSFVLTSEELENLRFQFGTSRSWGGRRYMPRVFRPRAPHRRTRAEIRRKFCRGVRCHPGAGVPTRKRRATCTNRLPHRSRCQQETASIGWTQQSTRVASAPWREVTRRARRSRKKRRRSARGRLMGRGNEDCRPPCANSPRCAANRSYRIHLDFIEIRQTERFSRWLNHLRDHDARARILTRIHRW
jgi:hypothetical protein